VIESYTVWFAKVIYPLVRVSVAVRNTESSNGFGKRSGESNAVLRI
jgi:hypothetical protein